MRRRGDQPAQPLRLQFHHHWSNARKLIGDEARAASILESLRAERPEREFAGKELALLRYAPS